MGVHAQDDVVCAYEDSAVSMPALEARCREMVETLNGFGRENFGARSALEKIRRAGQMLWDDILGPASKEKLASADADFLILDLDDRLTHIPWELLRIDQRLLCERFCVGRKRIKTSRKTAKSALRHLDGKKPLSMLILADPKGDLNEAGAEGWRLCNMANRSGRVRASLYSRIAPSEIQMKIRDYDMVHFAGHARYDAQNPENNGWELDGVDFTAADVKKNGGRPRPAFPGFFQRMPVGAKRIESRNDNVGSRNVRAGRRFFVRRGSGITWGRSGKSWIVPAGGSPKPSTAACCRASASANQCGRPVWRRAEGKPTSDGQATSCTETREQFTSPPQRSGPKGPPGRRTRKGKRPTRGRSPHPRYALRPFSRCTHASKTPQSCWWPWPAWRWPRISETGGSSFKMRSWRRNWRSANSNESRN